ncbi:MAG TPA: CpsD/CapB family tyrosine-protein kinase [Candidatus Aquilonibacter sp.]|nr:CpsD/CapB family tyrosine-protein kinase [Candidatus Aquilonibacter sp.]
MSRIHEALKQATKGQPPAPLAGLAAPPVATSDSERSAAGADWLSLNLTPALEPPPALPAAPFGNGLTDLWKGCTKRTWKFDPAYSVFAGKAPSAECSEQFRKLRSKLYQIQGTEPLHTLLVTSTVPAEGKTFVALNLALAITRQHGRRVLLIDGDLRAPKLASCLGVPAAPGLTEFLCGAVDEASIVQTDTEGALFFIPGGNMVANPTEMLGTERLQWLIGRMAPLFDWVIIDAPPVLPVSDAGILATYCDGVLVVIRAGSTAYDAVGTALQELRGKKLLGVVLNRVETRERYDAYPYYAESRTELA